MLARPRLIALAVRTARAGGRPRHGACGTGDVDRDLQPGGFDLVREAAVLGALPATLDCDQAGSLVGDTNLIDGADFDAPPGKLGQRP